ncbi:MAG: DsrE/DsrF/DrsH-like family protein, partial [Actinomycetota bacterium]|nr:DsrE/DsrF/DrsH-like family protein [Actinomycetota bacterium]
MKENKLTIIACSGDLDRIWPTLILSTTAAASGMEASVFFTFWGLFALVKPGTRITGENWM